MILESAIAAGSVFGVANSLAEADADQMTDIEGIADQMRELAAELERRGARRIPR
jgi:hypothetical protein